jgi:hypothetical protein
MATDLQCSQRRFAVVGPLCVSEDHDLLGCFSTEAEGGVRTHRSSRTTFTGRFLLRGQATASSAGVLWPGSE